MANTSYRQGYFDGYKGKEKRNTIETEDIIEYQKGYDEGKMNKKKQDEMDKQGIIKTLNKMENKKIECPLLDTQDKDTQKPKETANNNETTEAEAQREARTIGLILDVVITATSISDYVQKASEIKNKIYIEIGDAYIAIKAYEWNYRENTIFATIEIQKALFGKIDIYAIETEYMKIHAVDEISYTTATATKRKIK